MQRSDSKVVIEGKVLGVTEAMGWGVQETPEPRANDRGIRVMADALQWCVHRNVYLLVLNVDTPEGKAQAEVVRAALAAFDAAVKPVTVEPAQAPGWKAPLAPAPVVAKQIPAPKGT
jgi:hypothetical protein